jgi:repressor LexA
MPLCQTIRQLREQLGLSQDELAKRLGYKSRSTIAKIESGSNDIPQSKIAAFAAALETTPARLLGLDTPAEPTPQRGSSAYTKRVPLLGTIAAGCPLFAEENIEEYIEINDSIRADLCLRVQGDSMIGARIYDGDLVFIRKQPDVADGEIAAVLVDDSATLKRVYKDRGAIRLHSENPKYRPMVFTADNCDSIRILGKAVAFQGTIC